MTSDRSSRSCPHNVMIQEFHGFRRFPFCRSNDIADHESILGDEIGDRKSIKGECILRASGKILVNAQAPQSQPPHEGDGNIDVAFIDRQCDERKKIVSEERLKAVERGKLVDARRAPVSKPGLR